MVSLDPITVEVVENALIGVVREMRATVARAAFGPVIYEAHDFSCALLTDQGEIAALSEDMPVHIFPTTYSVLAAQEKFGESIHPGDVFMMNDPYLLGTHLNDVAHLYPYFLGRRLTLWISPNL